MAKSNLTVKIDADVKRAADGIQSIDRKIDSIGKSAESASSKMQKFLAFGASLATAVAGFKALAGAASELVSIYAVQEQAESKLNNTIKATNNAAGVTAKGVKDLASSLQSVTTYGDEAIIGIESLYIATGKIGNEIMPRATEAALDMAAAMGTDVNEAAKKLSRVLADPTQGLDALKESNIMLTKAQMDEIAQLARQGNALEAQSKILSAVESAYAGTARAIGSTDTGKLTQIANVYGDIKEGLGSALLNSIGPALDILYGSLEKIAGWVARYTTKVNILDAAKDGLDLSGYSDEELSEALEKGTADYRKAQLGSHNRTLLGNAVSAIENEMYLRVVEASNDAFFASDKASIDALKHPVGHAGAKASAPTKVASATFFDTYKGSSKTYLNSFYDEEIRKGREEQKQLSATSAEYKILEESIDSLIQKKKALNTVAPPDDIVGSFLGQYGGLSEKKLIADVQTSLDEADEALTKALENHDESSIDYINEVIIALQKQKNELMGIKTAEEEATEEAEKRAQAEEDAAKAAEEAATAADRSRRSVVSAIHLWTSASNDVLKETANLIDVIQQNGINDLEMRLKDAKDAYEEYFSDVDGMYKNQQTSLDRYYEAGLISAEDYCAQSEALSQAEADAKEEQQAKIDELQADSDKAKERQFNSQKGNDIAQATINGALAISDIWAQHGANPVTAGVLTGLATTAIALQIATIAAQNYTPMAAGGIVDKPTHALIGEAGAEAVIPLNKFNLEQKGLSESGNTGSITIVVNVENNYSESDLAENVYNGIEKAQSRGLLPNWRYV